MRRVITVVGSQNGLRVEVKAPMQKPRRVSGCKTLREIGETVSAKGGRR